MSDRSITPQEGTPKPAPLVMAVSKAFDAIEQLGRSIALVARSQVRILRSQERTEKTLVNIDANLESLLKGQQSFLQHRLGPLESVVSRQGEEIAQLRDAARGAANGHG